MRVRVVGLENWPADLPILDKEGELIPRDGMEQLDGLVDFEPVGWDGKSEDTLEQEARTAVAMDKVDLVLLVRPNFQVRLSERLALAEQIDELGQPGSNADVEGETFKNDADSEQDSSVSVGNAASGSVAATSPGEIEPEHGLRVIGNLARDRSQIANRRLGQIISSWQKAWVSEHLTTAGVNPKVILSRWQ